jgi:hypothetical protein
VGWTDAQVATQMVRLRFAQNGTFWSVFWRHAKIAAFMVQLSMFFGLFSARARTKFHKVSLIWENPLTNYGVS